MKLFTIRIYFQNQINIFIRCYCRYAVEEFRFFGRCLDGIHRMQKMRKMKFVLLLFR